MLAHDHLSSLAYPMITHTHLVASNLPKKPWLLGMVNKQYWITVKIIRVMIIDRMRKKSMI